MVIFPLYAITVWLIIWRLPTRWMRALATVLAVLPVWVVSNICVYYLPLPPKEPRPEWLLILTFGYAGLILLVGGMMSFITRRRDEECHKCGYDMSGNELGVCPECGTPVRCRVCHHMLVHEDFGPCHNCGEPFPRFAPIERVPEAPTAARTQTDQREAIERYTQTQRERARSK